MFEYPEGAEFIGSEVRWHYENLEPTSDDNWSVKVIRPGMWNYFSNKQKVAKNNPDDVDAWVEYALACHYLSINDHKDWIFSENGAYFFDYCKQAFAHAEELGANSVDFHTGIALNLYLDEVLNRTGYYNVDINSPSIQKALFHLDKALFLDFENHLAREIFSYIEFSTGKDLPDPGPSITPSPTRTKVPTRTITKTPTASPTIPKNIPATITSSTPTSRLRTPTLTATFTTTTATLTPSPIPATATPLPPTPTPQRETEEGSNPWAIGTGVIALVALIGGGFVWVQQSRQQ